MKRSQGTNKQAANETNSTRKCSRWTPAEDRALITAINDLMEMGGCKADNGQFKNGTWGKVEAIMLQKLPGYDKKAKPHIESRVKLLTRQYETIADMLSQSDSGFGWNDEGKFVTCPQSVWDDWVKSHPNAASLRNKPFPLFDELGRIIVKDWASGNESASALDALEELEDEENDIEVGQVYDLTTEDEVTPNTQSRQMKISPSTAPTNTKTSKLVKISGVMENASEHIRRLASCSQHESQCAERRMQVTSEVMKIEGLTTTQVLFTSKKIALNPLEVDFFFSLPDDYRYAYIQSLLLPDQANQEQEN